MASTDSKDTERAMDGEDLLNGQSEKPKEYKHERRGCCSCTKKKLMILVIVLVMLLLYALGLGIGLAIGLSKKNTTETGNQEHAETKIPLGAVVSDHEACSQVGRDVLMRHGTATDAALATLICNGIRTPHSMGIGGGCSMVTYNRGEGTGVVVDGMMTAPSSMTIEKYTRLTNSNFNAARIAVPGELKAYKIAHNKYGWLPWSELFKPTIQMLKEGFPLSDATAKALMVINSMGVKLTMFPNLCSVFCANTTTGEAKKAGDIIHWPKMIVTLEGIAEQGPDYIYESDLTHTLVEEIQKREGVLKYRDFVMDYKAKLGQSYSVNLGDYTLHTMPGATGGPVVAMIANIIEGFNFTKPTSLESKAEMYHKIVEAMKFTYADRARLGDPDFENCSQILDRMNSEDYARHIQSKITSKTHEEAYYTDTAVEFEDTMGTSHVGVISPYGDAVSVTSTINYYFGSMEMSESTGIIWNNEMDDFSTKEPDTINFIEPGKRPRSSMAPVILVDKHGKVKMVIGGSGGTKIANTVAEVLIRMLWLEQPVDEAVEEKRFHHMLAGNVLTLEKEYSEDMKEEFSKKGHKVKMDTRSYMAVVEALLVDKDGVIRGHADSRKKPGKPSYIYDYYRT